MVDHVKLWLNIFTFALGFSSLILITLSFMKYRKKLILFFFFFFLAILVEQLAVLYEIVYDNIYHILSYDPLTMTARFRTFLSNSCLVLLLPTTTSIH